MATLTKKGYPAAVKEQDLSNEQLIQKALKLDELQYCQLKFEAGTEYAKRSTGGDVMGYEFLIKTRYYWQWWKNEWAKRDADFLQLFNKHLSQVDLYDQYIYVHSPARLCNDSLMSKKHAAMFGFAIDELVKEDVK